MNYTHCNTIILAGVLLIAAGCGGGGAPNQPPQVDAGSDQMVAAGQLVNLAASASDGDGSVSRYLWVQDAGDSVIIDAPDSASASFSMPTKPQSESLVFTVTVTDNGGLSASDSITITHENAAPTVDAGSDQNVVAGATAVLSGSAEDGDGDIISYAWSQTSGDSVTLNGADQVEDAGLSGSVKLASA